MPKLKYAITGLEEFQIMFDTFCEQCEIQRHCKFGAGNPFQIDIACGEIHAALEKKKEEKMVKLQKQHPDWDWDKREKKASVSKAQIFSQLWNEKIKARKEEILCLDSRRTDSMVTSQRGEEWWSAFRDIMTIIEKECAKIR